MKLKQLVPLREKKEAIATSPTTNITLHFDKGFNEVGETGSPEATFTISISSTGGKEFYRGVSDRSEEEKINEGIRLELRRALRRFDKQIQNVLTKYKYQSR